MCSEQFCLTESCSLKLLSMFENHERDFVLVSSLIFNPANLDLSRNLSEYLNIHGLYFNAIQSYLTVLKTLHIKCSLTTLATSCCWPVIAALSAISPTQAAIQSPFPPNFFLLFFSKQNNPTSYLDKNLPFVCSFA